MSKLLENQPDSTPKCLGGELKGYFMLLNPCLIKLLRGFNFL
jgi:hypothetical protein